LNLLLDTHIWLWLVGDPGRLGSQVANELRNPQNEVWISPISSREILLLTEKKRLQLNVETRKWIRENILRLALREAAFTHEVALQAAGIDLPHRDPADRILAATALVYNLTLVTADRRLLGCHGLPLLPNR
jgi:PIN domain nuclease of toxin-antitoxin system